MLANDLMKQFPNEWCAGGQANVHNHLSMASLRLAAELAGKHRVQYITMLREPVARAVSEWKNVGACFRGLNPHGWNGAQTRGWLQTHPGEWEYFDLWVGAESNMSMTSFLNCSACEMAWSNRQTRMLGFPGVDLRGVVDERTLQTALTNLDAMAFVGITERFADSILLLTYAFRDVLPHLGRFTVPCNSHAADNSSTPTDAELASLASVNAYDTRLYAAAYERFEREFTAMQHDASFPQRLMQYSSTDNLTYTLGLRR